MPIDDGDGNRALSFNDGADHRLWGRPIEDNPHEWGTSLWLTWRAGYLHVDEFWGVDSVADFWRPIRRLPGVREEFAS
jgi:hypothetical protein